MSAFYANILSLRKKVTIKFERNENERNET